MLPLDVMLRRFEEPDEVRAFEKGRVEIIRVQGQTFGRATYEPGWKWSVHVGGALDPPRCVVEHIGLVLAGAATAAFDDGQIIELRAGALFYIPPIPHDSWVIGNEPYVSLHLLGADEYARRPSETPGTEHAMEALRDASRLYEVERRAEHAARHGFRITELQISPSQKVPWHCHTNVQDTFYVLSGHLRIFLREPKEEVRLTPGDTYSVRPRRPHLVTNAGDTSATFLVLQGIGEYDFVPLT
jgi:quercetin dioxygenase-like cupin family protein